MDKIVKVILLTNSERLISEIEEVGAEIGEPDCKLINPHEIWEGNNLAPMDDGSHDARHFYD